MFGGFAGGSAPLPAARASKERTSRSFSGGRDQLVAQEFHTDGCEESCKLT